jgi:voltage-gated potassium channel
VAGHGDSSPDASAGPLPGLWSVGTISPRIVKALLLRDHLIDSRDSSQLDAACRVPVGDSPGTIGPVMERLHAARERDGYARWERRTNGPLFWLALLFVAVLLAPLLVQLQPRQMAALTAVGAAIWAAFAVDYAARLFLAQERRRFVRTHRLDLLVVLLPLLRPLRALLLVRLTGAGALLGLARGHAQRSLHARVTGYVGAVTVVVLGVAAVAVYDAERGGTDPNITSLPDALWWAMSTVTSVGYGDLYPTTGAGRLVAATLMVVGIALLSVVTATVAAWFVSRLHGVRQAEEPAGATLEDVLAELREVRARLDALDPPANRQAPR